MATAAISLFRRCSMTTSAAHVASRHIDHTFEKLMSHYKHYLRVLSIQDLILASSDHSLPLAFLSSLSQKLRLNRGAPYFLRKYPHIFSLHYDATNCVPFVRLTPAATDIVRLEADAISIGIPNAIERLIKILSMSPSRMVPLRAVFKFWKELGLPDDFDQSVIALNPSVFGILNNPKERNTHLLHLLNADSIIENLTPAIEKWRIGERETHSKLDPTEIELGFKQVFPPGMKLKKNFRKKVREWQRLPYLGPYDKLDNSKKMTKTEMMAREKRAVGIIHELLSLTVEKTAEVEQITQFRKWFGIDTNIRDLVVDHPGIFYLSTKGKRHTVFLREAYNRGRLVDPNPVYEVRRKLLYLVMVGRRGMWMHRAGDKKDDDEEVDSEEVEDDDDD